MCFLKKVDKIAKLSCFYTFKPVKFHLMAALIQFISIHMVYKFYQNEKESKFCQLYANFTFSPAII